MTDEVDYLELIRQGADVWNRWREAHPDIQPDLHRAYLFEADLKEVNLRGVNLNRACLIGANLKLADLREAELEGAYASQAIFAGADLRQANLKQANLTEAILTSADLSDSHAEGANLSAAQLTGACIENWCVDASTDFTEAQGDYLYQQRSRQGRQPATGSFNPDTLQQFLADYQAQQSPPETGSTKALASDPIPTSPSSTGAKPATITASQTLPPYKSAPYRAAPYRATLPKPEQTKPPVSPRSLFSSRKRIFIASIGGAGLVILLIFVGLLMRLIAILQANPTVPSLVLGSEVDLASLPCNELPPPDLQSQEPSQVYSSGIAFYGQFEDGIPADGRGIMVFTNGDRYDGEFKAGQRHGCGTFTFANGRQYMGQFETDQFQGIGVWTLETGDRYIGEFESSRCEGWGTFLFSDGSSRSGTWENGNLVGDGLSCNRGVTSEPEQTAS